MNEYELSPLANCQKLFRIALIASVIIIHTARGQQQIKVKDSIQMKSQIEAFYSWYVGIIKNQKLDGFEPGFVKQADGMTTLDFTNYKKELTRYNFTHDFIQRKVNAYRPCVENLHKIPYETFLTFQDLDEFERIACDFSNRYEWTGGMEPIDDAKLSRFKGIDKKTFAGYLEFTTGGRANGGAVVIFRKMRSGWGIDGLELK